MEGDLRNVGCILLMVHFNPLPPHGGRRKLFIQFNDFIHISIHSLRMEGDPKRAERLLAGLITPSAWRETYKCAIIYTEVRVD